MNCSLSDFKRKIFPGWKSLWVKQTGLWTDERRSLKHLDLVKNHFHHWSTNLSCVYSREKSQTDRIWSNIWRSRTFTNALESVGKSARNLFEKTKFNLFLSFNMYLYRSMVWNNQIGSLTNGMSIWWRWPRSVAIFLEMFASRISDTVNDSA